MTLSEHEQTALIAAFEAVYGPGAWEAQTHLPYRIAAEEIWLASKRYQERE